MIRCNAFGVNQGEQHRLYDVELLGFHDKPATRSVGYVGLTSQDGVSGEQLESGPNEFTFFDDPPKEKMRLRITVLEDVHEVPVTFEIVNLKFGP